jgi:hypothetical protein
MTKSEFAEIAALSQCASKTIVSTEPAPPAVLKMN